MHFMVGGKLGVGLLVVEGEVGGPLILYPKYRYLGII